MRTNLITDIGQIAVNGKIIFSIVIRNWANALRLRFDGMHDTDLIRDPNEGGFPIATFQNALDSLIGWNGIAAFFTPNACDRITEKGVAPIDFQ